MIVLCATAMGIAICSKMREKRLIYKEIIDFCSVLEYEISSKKTPITKIFEDYNIKESHLNFIDERFLYELETPKGELSNSENKKLGEFLFSLGKNDSISQLCQIEEFKQLITKRLSEYESDYASKRKIYLTISISAGLIFSIILV